VLRALWHFRDEQARRSDRPAFKVLPDSVLVRVAEVQPRSMDKLDDLFAGKAAMKKRYGKGLVDAVVAGLADDAPLPKPKPAPKPRRRKGSPPARLKGKSAERAMIALKDWRNELTRNNPLYTPITSASNAVLKEIARARPTTLEELSAIPDVRKWQVKELGDQILQVLDREVPWPPPEGQDDDSEPPSKRRRRKR